MRKTDGKTDRAECGGQSRCVDAEYGCGNINDHYFKRNADKRRQEAFNSVLKLLKHTASFDSLYDNV